MSVHKPSIRLKNCIIIMLLLFHSSCLLIWTLLGERLHSVSASKSELVDKNHSAFKALKNYIALAGSDQYWDFFAPAPYYQHKSLMVCEDVNFPGTGQQVKCIGHALYQSYDGELSSLFQNFSGNRSRSYRFTEQFLALDDEMVYEKFLHYWSEKYENNKSGYLYLIAQYHPVIFTDRTIEQHNKLIWAIKLY